MPSRALLLSLTLGCLALTGCKHHPWRRDPPPACPPSRGPMIPPAGIPDGAPTIPLVPRGAAPDAGSELLLPQPPPPGRGRSEYPRIVPADPGGAILGNPDFVERPKVVPADPPAAESRSPNTEPPAGIADFTQVKDGVSAGQRPTLEGLDALKVRGYKTVIYLRGPKDDDTTDRRQVERRDMKFLSLVLTADMLTQQWIDDFNEAIGATGSRPVFIYATDPQLAGATWYLHFRTAEFLTHDEARVRAGRLGRIDENSPLFRAAVQVLATKP